MHENEISEKIIGAAIQVHKEIGPGLLESAYEECLAHELNIAGLQFERQKPLPVIYKDTKLDCGYRMDLVVENLIIVEVKAVTELAPIHSMQLLTYLRLYQSKLGLLINFNIPVLKDGIKRVINGYL